ncbi:MAG: bifunctional diaminohydroxyphosphoribosylaminopyrimidine deaminase/5-amino-6-(5-phosphoribosylamino)uracil reductase RibD, partial [Bacillota bacterium]
VVIASKDPNPLVAGRGINMLKEAGIEVESGLMDEENKALNEIFFHYMKTKRPFVIMKSAMSADGKTATHTFDSKWITNAQSRKFVHETRNRVSGIMVGVNTVIKDNPRLNVRLENQPVSNPTPIILDNLGEMPLDSKLLSGDVRPIVAVTTDAPKDTLEALEQKGANVITVKAKNGLIDLDNLMDVLGEMKIDSILLEGGSCVNDSAFKEGIVQSYHMFIAPKIIGGKHALTPVGGSGFKTVDESVKLTRQSITEFGEDILVIYKVGG